MLLAILISFLCLLLLILALIFSILPGIPGPPIAYSGLILISLAGAWEIYPPSTLIILFLLTAFVYIIDSVLPFISAKRSGTGKGGIWGSILGMLIGLIFFPPFGSIIGAFLGALLGEMIFNKENKYPVKSAFGILTGTFLGIIIKIGNVGIITYFIVKGLIQLF